MNVHQRINEVRKAVSYLQKEKEVTGAGTYKVVTHDQVTAAVREHLIAQGILVVPRLLSSKVADTGTVTKNSVPIIRYEAWFEIDYVNCDDPQDKVTVPTEAHALDQGDKAPGKAISYATKYTMLKLFSIETGEDEEARPDAKGRKDAPGAPLLDKPISATTGIKDSLTQEQIAKVDQVASSMLDWLINDSVEDAVLVGENAGLDTEEKIYLWSQFDSKQRSAMTKASRAMRAKAEAGTQA